jgi:hypothetical protein
VQVDVNTRQLQERDNQVTGSGGDALPSEVSPDPFKPDPSPVLEQLSISNCCPSLPDYDTGPLTSYI